MPVSVPDGARTALVAFPQAGAGPATFLRWRGALGEDTGLWAVCLPGRDHRLAVPPVAELAPLVQGVAAAIGDLRVARLVLLGQCSGAMLAYEVAHHLVAAGRPESLAALVVIGQTSPDGPPGPEVPARGAALEDIVDYLRREGATPPEVLAHHDYLRLLAPAIRADLRLIAEYRHDDGRPPLPVPVAALAGGDDPHTPPEQVAGWWRLTSSAFSLHVVPGVRSVAVGAAAVRSAIGQLLP